jgi:DNA mismatch repair protein MutL
MPETVTRRPIRILPEHLANRIAAGEVIQRPESVVKELLENSLDAGATSVTVVIKDAGSTLIQVSDNGAGISEEDAAVSFQRHATSKISTAEDLDAISTYGFRGEALASIAAVSRVAMKTRGKDAELATTVAIEGGSPPRLGREAREQGTTVSVGMLFYNTPARRKFLKSPATEFRHIYEGVQRVSLSRPDVAVHFVSDGETLLQVRPSSREQRVREVLGDRLAAGLMPVERADEFMSVSGYIAKPAFGAKTRASQMVFLNGRYIVSRSLNHAVFSAYEHLLPPGTFPMFLLFITIDPSRVDVNVHPSKLEVKFDDEQAVHRFISAAVRTALASSGAVPSLTMGAGGGSDARLRFGTRQHDWPLTSPEAEPWSFPERPAVDRTTGELLGIPSGGKALPGSGAFAEGTASRDPLAGPAAPVWQLHSRYILTPVEGGLLVVDQHVAHERVIYERAMHRMATGARTSQQLLFPVTVELTPDERALATELEQHLAGLGFDIRPFGGSTLILDGVPPDVPPGSETGILHDVLALYREYQSASPLEVRETLAKSFACRSAVKSGDALTPSEMYALLDDLAAATMPFVCPHGRPVLLRIPTEELDRRFGRL